MTMARGHSRCCSRFEEFPAAIANWCSSMKINPASYDIFFFIDVQFNRFNGYRSSISELQVSMDVICRVPLFKVSLKFKSRDFRCVLVMINAARFIETCFGVHPCL